MRPTRSKGMQNLSPAPVFVSSVKETNTHTDGMTQKQARVSVRPRLKLPL